MTHFFQPTVTEEILARIEKLTPDTKPLWGKMTVAQMLAHNYYSFEAATGKVVVPRSLLGRIIGQFVRDSFLSNMPLSKNSPTMPRLIVKDERDFDVEKQKLISIVKEFSSGGPEKVTQAPHSFFGHFTPEEWSRQMYKHLDHHLQQFGV